MLRNPKTLVMVVGHKNPHYLVDTADSIRYYNKGNYDVVFAIDFNKEAASSLRSKYGKEHVFVSSEQNGWGRGILRTIIHALDYFKPMAYHHVITMDSDALCVGPFIDIMSSKVVDTDIFFVGSVWYTPSKDFGFHHSLRASGFMGEYTYNFRTEMAAGPCMMWTNHCFKFFKQIGLMPADKFDKLYPLIHFAHDQISTWLLGCNVCRIENIGHIMEMKWRQSLPSFSTPTGLIPITHSHTAIIHPTEANMYREDNVREHFRSKRTKSIILL